MIKAYNIGQELKKFMRIIVRIIHSAFQNLIRHSLLSFTTITIMTLTLISITTVIISNIVIQEALDVVEDKLNISVELHDGLSEEQILDFKTQLETQSSIKDIIYISKDAALKDFKEKLAQEPNIIQFVESLNYNPLYATFTVTANNPDDYESLKKFLNNDSFEYIIKEIKNESDQSERINTFRDFSASIRNIGLIISILFGVISLLIIFNTIKMGIHYRKQEIKIMKLVGASYHYIMLPFIIEGVLYGIFGMIFTGIAIFSLFTWLQSSPFPLIQFIETSLHSFYIGHSQQIIILQILVALFLGISSSYAAIYSYLHKKQS